MRWRAAAMAAMAAMAVTAVLAGCAGLPTSPGVHVERTVEAGSDASAQQVRILPAGPTEGASPVAVVRGFLDAQAADQEDYGIAREFLTGAPWSTAGGVSVYTAATETQLATGASAATVRVSLARSASLDRAGSFTPRADTVTEVLHLQRIAGEWRIADPPAGLFLTAGDLQRSYTLSTLWWFTPDESLLVPEQRWLPVVESGRQTQLVRALLGGPSAALAGAVRTAVPPAVSLAGSVSTSGSDMVVDLSQPAASLPARQAALLLVQLAHTLQQAPDGSAVRLEVDGQPLPTAGAPQRLALSGGAAYDPDSAAPDAPPLALQGCPRCRVVAVPDGTSGQPRVPAAAARLDGRDLLVAVPSPLGGAVAALELVDGRRQLLVARADGIQDLGEVGDGTPSWSASAELVVPEATGLLLVSPGGRSSVVPWPAGLGTVTSARVARDGLRVLVVARGVAYVLVLDGLPGRPSLDVVDAVSTGLGTVSAAVWTASATLAMIAAPTGATATVVQTAIDGSSGETVALPPAVGPDPGLAAASGAPVLVAGDGLVDQLTAGSTWRPVLDASSPAAPG